MKSYRKDETNIKESQDKNGGHEIQFSLESGSQLGVSRRHESQKFSIIKGPHTKEDARLLISTKYTSQVLVDVTKGDHRKK